ncbi:MAG TPA: putative metal-dependent hydrolase [Longimicrobiaceae bacterium]|nr:putative metal-dependent hydrolase [Longimicrobiaceae bacterium]
MSSTQSTPDPPPATSDQELRYPVGPFSLRTEMTPEDRSRWIVELAELPARLRAAVGDLSDVQLDTPYRPGGWTVRQVVHHLSDSNVNGYIRFCTVLTETHPILRTFDRNAWALLPCSRTVPVDASLDLLGALHRRWVVMLGQVAEHDWSRTLFHPERGAMTLGDLLQLYAWHGRHHLAHITGLRRRMAW